MPRMTRIGLSTLAAAAVFAGCGGDDGTIPEENSNELLSQLGAIESNIPTNCDLAREQAQQFQSGVGALPSEVEPEVREGLSEAAGQLVELANDPEECPQGTSGAAEVLPTETEETPDPAETSTTTTEPTTTDEPAQDEEEPAEETEEPPADTGRPEETPGEGPPADAGGDDSGGIAPGRAEGGEG